MSSKKYNQVIFPINIWEKRLYNWYGIVLQEIDVHSENGMFLLIRRICFSWKMTNLGISEGNNIENIPWSQQVDEALTDLSSNYTEKGKK